LAERLGEVLQPPSIVGSGHPPPATH
jgi:hypothetical protein